MDEPLTLKEAARLTGYSIDHLCRLVREGKLANVGRKHAPRVRRGDLAPKLAPLREMPPPVTLDSLASIARAITTAREE
ncbi:MAG: hypothetical protein ACOY71_12525 [Gemmatimonadota bacterium]